MGNPGVRLLVPSVRARRRAADGGGGQARAVPARERRRGAPSAWRSASTASSRRAEARRAGRRLGEARAERVERGGRAPRRARASSTRDGACGRWRERARIRRPQEWWRRLDAERQAPLGDWPPPADRATALHRTSAEVVDRRGGSRGGGGGRPGVQRRRRCWPCARTPCAAASWSSAPRPRPGSAADGSRSPPGGSPTPPLAPRWPSGRGRERAWPWPTGPPWRAMPSMAARFEHVVHRRPAAVPAPRASASALEPARTDPIRFLHLAWGEAEIELALRVHAEEWPRALPWWRSIGRCDRGDRASSCGPGPCELALHGAGEPPRSPEVAARRLRVLEELGAIGWERPAPPAPSASYPRREDLERLPSLCRLPRAL